MLFGGLYVLWEDPLVIGCWGRRELRTALNLQGPVSVLYWPAWLWSARTLPDLIRWRWIAFQRGKPLHFMRSAVSEDRMLRRLGFPGTLASSNCHVNEGTFRITHEPKRYDAVYIAQMQPFKRMHLAAQVQKLYFVTYGPCRTPDGQNDLHRFEPAVRHADFNRTWASFDQIASVINQSRVGLALSAVEGGMLASVEYMLCGVPQVSTPCQGGRELFFDERFVRVASPDPSAVARAVADLASREIDPELVRSATLEKVNEHRMKLCTYVCKVIEQAGGKSPGAERVYERVFTGEGGSVQWFRKLDALESYGIA